jgi:hypothetical protein
MFRIETSFVKHPRSEYSNLFLLTRQNIFRYLVQYTSHVDSIATYNQCFSYCIQLIIVLYLFAGRGARNIYIMITEMDEHYCTV